MDYKKFNDYEGFVEKFKTKKTTDDCHTPPEVYEVIKDWVCNRYGINPETIVRPFYPGGDFENFGYPAGCLVLDNPPFSLLAKIKRFYLEKDIKFFLFAPSLTMFSSADLVKKICHIVVGAGIIYENGARVNTSFVTNLDKQNTALSAPDLYQAIKDANQKGKKRLPKCSYPDEVITSADLLKFSLHGVAFNIPTDECVYCGCLDAQKVRGKAVFGGGLLVSAGIAKKKAIAEKTIAEKTTVEKTTVEKTTVEKTTVKKNETIKWRLSEKERRLSASLGSATELGE